MILTYTIIEMQLFDTFLMIRAAPENPLQWQLQGLAGPIGWISARGEGRGRGYFMILIVIDWILARGEGRGRGYNRLDVDHHEDENHDDHQGHNDDQQVSVKGKGAMITFWLVGEEPALRAARF